MTRFGEFLGWLGGRSLTELREHGADECDFSIDVGWFALISAGTILVGQYLFWSHLPHTRASAPFIAVVLTVLYVAIYRGLIRASEVATRLGKGMLYSFAGTMMSVNALLAGHEVVLLAFRPQVEAQVTLNSARGVSEYGKEIESSLALPRLRGDSKSLDEAMVAVREERGRIPDAVTTLLAQAQQCDGIAGALRSRIPIDPEAIGHAAAYSAWREQRARCSAMRGRADGMLREHQAQLHEQLTALGDRRRALDTRLKEATAEHEAKMKRATPSLNESATSGFARHGALWAAVNDGRIPAWAAIGLLAVALLLEGLSFVAKLLLPADAATLARREKVQLQQALGDLRRLVLQGYRANVPSVMADLAGELAAEAKNDVRNAVIPGLRHSIAASTFEKAHRATDEAQRRTRRGDPSLIRRLADLFSALRGQRPAHTPG